MRCGSLPPFLLVSDIKTNDALLHFTHAGTFQKSYAFRSGAPALTGFSNTGDLYVARLDPLEGSVVTARSFPAGGGNGRYAVGALALDDRMSLYLAGNYSLGTLNLTTAVLGSTGPNADTFFGRVMLVSRRRRTEAGSGLARAAFAGVVRIHGPIIDIITRGGGIHPPTHSTDRP